MSDTITILQSEYDALVEDSNFLGALQTLGVDNWEGWDTACQLYNGEITEDDI